MQVVSRRIKLKQHLTIRDIADKAGVSPTAVSFAFNHKPGISQNTRDKILKIAAELDWAPNVRAGTLAQSRAGAIGLFIPHPKDSYSLEKFFFNFIFGAQLSLTTGDYDLLLSTGADLNDEITTYRKWGAQHRVDGVIILNPLVKDPRLQVLKQIGLPGIIVGHSTTDFPGIISDESTISRKIASYLLNQNAQSIAYISGPKHYLHTAQREQSLTELCEKHKIPISIIEPETYSETCGFNSTKNLLRSHHAKSPLGIIYDNEVLLLGGLRTLHNTDLKLGTDVIAFCWENSPVCRINRPPIPTLTREPAVLGKDAGRLIQQLLRGEPVTDVSEPIPDIASY